MLTIKRILLFLAAIIAASTNASAFFLNWGSQEPTQHPHYYYHQRLLSPVTYSYPQTEPPPQTMPVPTVPIQVPIQAQLTPASAIQQVQLVPCMCPVTQDFDYDKAQPESVFFTTQNTQQNNQQHKNAS